tara:strand:+ start:296 stop:625 length:330 start_codon:yes stop_codon:yes gene_type:complete
MSGAMNRIPLFKKVEALALGITVPVLLIGYTIFLLLTNEAVFWGRSSTAVYHGISAYLVSLLWFGVSGLLVGHFCLRTYHLLRRSSHKVFMWVSAILSSVGLVSAIVLA